MVEGHHLVEGKDAGGRRYFLDGRAVHAGDALDLRLPGDRWASVTFEYNDTIVFLRMRLGCTPRFRATAGPNGVWWVWDEKLDRRVTHTVLRESSADDPNRRPFYPLREVEDGYDEDEWRALVNAKRVAKFLNEWFGAPIANIRLRPPSAERPDRIDVDVLPLQAAELRWRIDPKHCTPANRVCNNCGRGLGHDSPCRGEDE